MSTPPVNTRVTPALDPVTYLSVEGVDDGTRGYIDDVISFCNDAHATLTKLHLARELWDKNPAATDEQRILAVGAEANKQQDRLARKLDRTVRDLEGRIATTEADLLRPVQAAAANPLAAEVRSHFKSADGDERAKLIREALEADDTATLNAVLGAQPFLSGMTALDREMHLHSYNSKKSPHVVARLEVMKRVRDLMEQNGANGPAFRKAFRSIVGAEPGVVNAIAKADAAARAALKIERTA